MANHNAQRGFSLLEILVAFSILALSLSVLMQVFSASLTKTELARDSSQALLLAQSMLASVGTEIPFENASSTGTSGNKFRWKIDAKPIMSGETSSLKVWEVAVRVAWGESTVIPERHITLHTMRIQPPPPQ